MQVRSLSGEDPLEDEMAARFSILAWKITWREEPGRLRSMGKKRKRPQSFPSPSPPPTPPALHTQERLGEGTLGKQPSVHPEESLHLKLALPDLDLGLPASRTVRKQISVVP